VRQQAGVVNHEVMESWLRSAASMTVVWINFGLVFSRASKPSPLGCGWTYQSRSWCGRRPQSPSVR